MFGQQDTQRCCTCSRCKKDAEKYTRGGINIRFVNLLAREVQKWADEELGGRKINVVTFAYQYSEEPPVYVDDDWKYRPIDDTVVAEDNVYVRLATYFCDNYFSLEDPRQIAKYRMLLSAWDTVADKFMLWDYHIDYYNYFNYYPTMQTWKDNLRLYREIGTEYVLMQSAQNEKDNWQANMEAYVASKLLWNIDRDVDELVDEFMTYYYGMAKNFVAEFKLNNDLYYRTLYERFSDYTLKLGSDSSASKYFDIGYLEKQIALMDRAVEAVSASSLDEKEKETLIARLKIIRAQPKFMIMLNYNSYYFDRQSEYRSYVDELLAELAQTRLHSLQRRLAAQRIQKESRDRLIMFLSYRQLKEKILGCFNGKNIGGTLGAPFECLRQINDVDFYVQKDIRSNPPPNDDLDLQIVWLNAVERFGAGVDHEILAEYWLTYIYPRWSEYGTGKANLIRGFPPSRQR